VSNSVSVGDLPTLISNVYSALAGLKPSEPVAEPAPEPAVSIRASVKNDHIVCLEDGKKLKMLKRHLATRYNMTPEQYRQRWNLPADYPMVAPAYAEKRRELAKKIGLGRKPAAPAPPSAAVARLPLRPDRSSGRLALLKARRVAARCAACPPGLCMPAVTAGQEARSSTAACSAPSHPAAWRLTSAANSLYGLPSFPE
jgi:predicted transcriptional regulator